MPKDVSLSKQFTNKGTGKYQKKEITVGCTSSPPQRKSIFLSLFKPERRLHEYWRRITLGFLSFLTFQTSIVQRRPLNNKEELAVSLEQFSCSVASANRLQTSGHVTLQDIPPSLTGCWPFQTCSPAACSTNYEIQEPSESASDLGYIWEWILA